MKDYASIHRQYGNTLLSEKEVDKNPFVQFESWLNEALKADVMDAMAMVLATVDDQGQPDTRVVLLKDSDENGFVFFTSYDSPKATQAEHQGNVALNFYWPPLSRQVRIRGRILRIPRADSEAYFYSRPRESQISTLASHQSTVIENRDALERSCQALVDQYHEKTIPCPANWGGYRVVPFEFEFFQGRDHRMNDRVRYAYENNQWKIARLSP